MSRKCERFGDDGRDDDGGERGGGDVERYDGGDDGLRVDEGGRGEVEGYLLEVEVCRKRSTEYRPEISTRISTKTPPKKC